MHQRDIPTLSVAEAAKLLTVHANTIRYRLTKGVYQHHKALTATGEVYMIDAADFYRQHPTVAPEGWLQEELAGPHTFIGDDDAIEGGDAARALEPVQEGATGALRGAVDARLQAVLDRLGEVEARNAALERAVQDATRIGHEDHEIMRQALNQMQQQQAVIYHEVRQQRGRGVLRRLMGL